MPKKKPEPPKGPRPCLACQIQDKFQNSPHEPGCRCYGVAFILGLTTATEAGHGYGDFSLCTGCAAIFKEYLTGSRLPPEKHPTITYLGNGENVH